MSSSSTTVGSFLRARREVLQPEEVGVARGPHRRVPGLRREEVARLAGISAEYYLRLEQGRDHQPSAEVLASIGRALKLDADGLRYLHRLAYPPLRSVKLEHGSEAVPDSVVDLLAQWSNVPAYVVDRNQDVLAANDLARVMAPGYLEPGVNMVEQVFTRAPRKPYPEGWERAATMVVASLRYHADLRCPRLQDIVGGLSIDSPDFRRMWALHDARPLTSGRVPTYVDPLGWVNFRWQTLEVPGGSGLCVTMFFGDTGSPEVSAIAYLAARIRETQPGSLILPADYSDGGNVARNRSKAALDLSSEGLRTKTLSS